LELHRDTVSIRASASEPTSPPELFHQFEHAPEVDVSPLGRAFIRLQRMVRQELTGLVAELDEGIRPLSLGCGKASINAARQPNPLVSQ
jgi:hypothetical protein